jgi:hypothetical protein
MTFGSAHQIGNSLNRRDRTSRSLEHAAIRVFASETFADADPGSSVDRLPPACRRAGLVAGRLGLGSRRSTNRRAGFGSYPPLGSRRCYGRTQTDLQQCAEVRRVFPFLSRSEASARAVIKDRFGGQNRSTVARGANAAVGSTAADTLAMCRVGRIADHRKMRSRAGGGSL